MYMTCKHYLERVLGWERSKLGFLGKKRFETRIFLTELMNVRLSKRQASVPSWFWTQFAWASAKRAPSEQAQLILDTVRLSESQASFKRASP